MNNLGKNLWELLDRLMRFVVFRVFRLKMSEENWKSFQQFVKFGIVGLSNTVISYVIYVVVLLGLQKNKLLPSIDYLMAQFVGFVLSVLWSFYWNRKFVFEADSEKVPWLQALLKSYVSYAFTGIFLNSVLAVLWVEILGTSKLIAPIVNLLVSVPLNFVLNKFWTFKKKK